MWDIEVDVACVGAGPSAVAGAVATADMGATVLLATPSAECGPARSTIAVQQRVGGFLGSWAHLDMDEATGHYLTALAEDYRVPGDFSGDSRMTVRAVRAMPAGGAAEAFIGSRLGKWNAACLASPYGLLFSSVSGWRTSKMRTEDGQSIEVQPIGTVSAADLTAGFDAAWWLRSEARARGVEERRFTELRRIVFDNGRIVGIELSTADGVLSVGVRRGLALSSGSAPTGQLPPTVHPTGVEDLQLCIVGQAASRFLRIELLGMAVPERPLCAASARQLRDALRDTRSLPSLAGRCGKPR